MLRFYSTATGHFHSNYSARHKTFFSLQEGDMAICGVAVLMFFFAMR